MNHVILQIARRRLGPETAADEVGDYRANKDDERDLEELSDTAFFYNAKQAKVFSFETYFVRGCLHDKKNDGGHATSYGS